MYHWNLLITTGMRKLSYFSDFITSLLFYFPFFYPLFNFFNDHLGWSVYMALWIATSYKKCFSWKKKKKKCLFEFLKVNILFKKKMHNLGWFSCQFWHDLNFSLWVFNNYVGRVIHKQNHNLNTFVNVWQIMLLHSIVYISLILLFHYQSCTYTIYFNYPKA